MENALWDWVSFAGRWLHVVTAIAWIGSSFYFVALDLGLRKAADAPKGVGGEAWQVHGGGFYHIQKYIVAPAQMPEQLTWFKWESYATWLSGFFLLAVVYYVGADLYLIERDVLDLPVWGAVALSLAALASGWLVYDAICKSRVGDSETGLMAAVYVLLVAEAYALTHVFSGRGAFVHIGAIIATIMTANVFLIIIPNQKKVVADLIAGRTPDPALGKQAKQRSTHNNYLTLPVVFLMLSGHYPLAFASRWNWVIVALVIVMGTAIRHWFNTMHKHEKPPLWTWILAAACFAAIVVLSLSPAVTPQKAGALRPESRVAQRIASPHFEAARDVILARCSMCHAQEPVWAGLAAAPKGVLLDSDERIALAAPQIYLQSAHTRAMPPGNVTEMSDDDRRVVATWIASAP